jgi:hypothetical protein
MSHQEGAIERCFTSLPGAAQLRILQLVCDSCGPTTPGTCWVSPVCKQWRDLALHVKRLRVLINTDYQPYQQQKEGRQQRYEQEQLMRRQQQQQRMASICAWLRRYAHQVVALAIIGAEAAEVLATLAEVASSRSSSGGGSGAAAAAQAPPAAAGGGGGDTAGNNRSLPLRHLAVSQDLYLLQRPAYMTALQPLLGALPHLQHLHLPLMDQACSSSLEEVDAAVVSALGPLQASTSLTSLELEGLFYGQVHEQLLPKVPQTLRHLSWGLPVIMEVDQMSFDHLTGLTSLRLYNPQKLDIFGDLRNDTFTSLRQLRRLVLDNFPMSDTGLLACKEQLVGLSSSGRRIPDVLSQLSRLEALGLSDSSPQQTKEALQQAPQLKRLSVQLEGALLGDIADCASYGVSQHLSRLTRVEGLHLVLMCSNVRRPQAPPVGLHSMTHLKQLSLGFGAEGMSTGILGPNDRFPAVAWAQAVAGLVNLEVLQVPAVCTAHGPPCWLTGLTRLVLLEVQCRADMIVGCPAAHISQYLVPSAGGTALPATSSASSSAASSDGGSSRSRSSSCDVGLHKQAVQAKVVCVEGFIGHPEAAAVELYRAVMAAVPLLPPHHHLFLGSWQRLQDCGVQLWPAPVAARLQQLLAL